MTSCLGKRGRARVTTALCELRLPPGLPAAAGLQEGPAARLRGGPCGPPCSPEDLTRPPLSELPLHLRRKLVADKHTPVSVWSPAPPRGPAGGPGPARTAPHCVLPLNDFVGPVVLPCRCQGQSAHFSTEPSWNFDRDAVRAAKRVGGERPRRPDRLPARGAPRSAAAGPAQQPGPPVLRLPDSSPF